MKNTNKLISKPLLTSALFSIVMHTAQATTTAQNIDKLTQSWLATEHSTDKLKADWMLEQQLLQQRISILKQQNAQLTKAVKASDQDTDNLTLRRQNLLSEQQQIETLLAEYKQVLPRFSHVMQTKAASSPTHLQQQMQDVLAKLATDKSLTAKYQILVDSLTQWQKNDQLLQVKQGMIQLADEQLMTEQLFLGNDQAWFSTPDNSRVGIGFNNNNQWQWQELTAQEQAALGSDYHLAVAQAIKDAKHLTPGRLIDLPVKLGSN